MTGSHGSGIHPPTMYSPSDATEGTKTPARSRIPRTTVARRRVSSSLSYSFPALYLYPLNGAFISKHIALIAGQRVKIGRQTNAKKVPTERNGYFDSNVLSRQHAEVWEENGKVRLFHFTHSLPIPLLSRSSSKTSRARTAHSSMASVLVQKVSNPSLLS